LRPSIPVLAALILLPVPVSAAPPEPASKIPSELTDYVGKEDKSFTWKVAARKQKKNFLGKNVGTVYILEVVSQTWHKVVWDHKLYVFVPTNVKPQATMVLWNEGDAPEGEGAEDIGIMVASQIKAPVAFLFGVPKQPLYGGKTEDALIAESFVRYLTTEDGSWPLLFPMVKSIVRGMDAVQAFAREEWKFEVKDFVIAGASKRGWTAWLTAATGDKRVKAIAPLVIDTLNIPVQMVNQVRAFGRPSEMIKDYADRLLIPIPKTPAAARLWTIIDPWSYRDRITVPKMIVCGTNDPYWPLDALNTYWDGLKGDKWILYVPNAGHFLCERDKNGQYERLPTRTLATVSAFCHAQVFDKPMPRVNCDMVCPAGAECLDVNLLCDVKPRAARVFSAEAKTRDFRQSYWEHSPLDMNDKKATCKVNLPKEGHRATLLELEFDTDGMTYTLSSPLRILDAPKK
jgi:PhoPQ-activated pathogenicity-related protein